MERVDCMLRESGSPEILYRLENGYAKPPPSFSLAQCNQYGPVHLNPGPDAETMADYYPATHDLITSASEESSLLREWLLQYGLWKQCRPLLKSQPPGRTLDVGCGKGYFLVEMRKHNWDVIGVDRNPHTTTFAQNALSLEVHDGSSEDIEFANEAFDAFTMWDSLEHLHHTYKALWEIRRILRPGGYL